MTRVARTPTRAGRVTRRAQAAGRAAASTDVPGPPTEVPLLHHRTPFGVGLLGATGALLAWWLGGLLLTVGPTLVLVVVAMFIAAGLNPAVEWMGRHGVRRSLSVLVVVVVFVGAVALFVLALVPVITEQVTLIVDNAPRWFDQLQTNRGIQRLDDRYDVIDRLQAFVEDRTFGPALFGGVVGVGLRLLSFLSNTFIVVVLTLYFLASLPTIKHSGYLLAPASHRPQVRSLGDRILANVGAYVSGAFLVAMAAGTSSLVFLLLAGLSQYALALAAVVTLLDVIPMIGATIGAVIVSAIGFATDVHIGIACVVFYIAYQQFENYVVYPRVMSRSVDLPGSIIVVAALAGASLLGVVGALLAIPTAAAITLLVREVFLPRQARR